MVIVQTPVRISFFGGGTDYPVWFKENGGAVLATAIDKFIYTSVRHLPAFHEHRHRLIYSKIEDVHEIKDIQHPAVREVFRYMEVKEGIELHHDCDLPARSGLGSSSSFVVGLLHALHSLNGEAVDKKMLARESIHVEQDLIGENVGCQDQIMAAYGGFNCVHFHQDGSFRLDPVIMRPERRAEFHSHLMLFYTGIRRIASDVVVEQLQNTPKKATELQAMHQMVREGIGLLGSASPMADFGKLLHEGWLAKKSLSSKISNPQIDEMYAAGREAGAIGGKLLGAGSGGFMLLFVPPEKQAAVRMRLKHLMHVPFNFEQTGSNVIFYRQAAAAS